MLRELFGPKRDEGTGHWRRLRAGGLYDLYCSSSYCVGDQTKDREVRETFGMCVGEGRGVLGLGGETWRKETTWKT